MKPSEYPTATKTRAMHWFADAFEYRQLCSDAVSQARGESAEQFAHDMMTKAVQYGLEAHLTVRQLEWLCKIADHDLPKRVKP